jgi:ribonuclease BN (tRNA processing enzyme)
VTSTTALTYTCVGPSCAWPTATRATSCHRIDVGDRTLLVDLGHGALQALRAAEAPLERLDAVLLTHLHLDHWADLVPLVWMRRFELGASAPLPVVVPEGQAARLRTALEALDALDVLDWIALTELQAGLPPTGVGPVAVTAVALPHSAVLTVNAYRLQVADGTTIVVSGDCGPSDALPAFARDAALLVLEATVPEPLAGHLTPGEAGAIVAAAQPGRALLCHYLEPLGGPAELAIARAACPDVPIAFAQPGERVPVAPRPATTPG